MSPPRRLRLLAGIIVGCAILACTGTGGEDPTPGTAGPTAPSPATPTPTASTPASGPSPSPTPLASPPPAVSTVPPTDAPGFDGAGDLVVTSADGVVSRVAPDDGTVQPLDDVSGATQVTPSPDGSTLVFTQRDQAGTPVVVIARGDELVRSAVPTAPYFHLVSPDGNRVASLADTPEGDGVSVLITDVAEASSVEVDRGQPYFLSWRDDGRRLAANVDATVLTTLDASGARTPLSATPGAFQAPAWTDDDRLVVVLATDGAGVVTVAAAQPADGMLAVVDPDDESREVLAEVSGAVSFDVAGDRVAWVDGDSQQSASLGPLEVVDLDGSARTTVSEEDVAMFEWSPDGERLLFHVVDADRGFVPHVWDGETVTAYESFLPTATLATQYLPFWPQYALSVTQWSPDGTAFAHAATPAPDQPGTIVVQALDGRRDEIAPGEMVVWTP